MKTLFIIILTFFIFLINLKSQEIPSYRLAVTPSRYVVDKDDTLKVLINISGYGDIKKSKLLVYSDFNVKINNGTFNLLYQTFFTRNFADYDIEKDKLHKLYNENKTDSFGIYGINIEFNPLELRIRTKETGKHIVYAIFTYTYDEKRYYSDRIEFEFYVNTWLDKNQTWLIILTTVIALIGLFNFRDIFRKKERSPNSR